METLDRLGADEGHLVQPLGRLAIGQRRADAEGVEALRTRDPVTARNAIVEELDQFPVAHADGLEVFAVVVEERERPLPCQRFAHQQRHQADAIVSPILRHRDFDHLR